MTSHFLAYYDYTYIFLGSMARGKKLVSQRSRVRLKAILVFIKNLNTIIIDLNQNTRTQMLLFVLYCPRPLAVIYFLLFLFGGVLSSHPGI